MLILSCLLLSCGLTAISGAPAPNEPFRSSRAPRDTITNYEVVTPVVIHSDGKKPYPKELKILVSSRADEFTLHLELNEGLLAPHFSSRYFDEHGVEIITKGHVNCYYHGKVVGYPEWTAVMSTCQGLQGSFGNTEDVSQRYHLEPLGSSDASINQPHALYLATEHTPQMGTCGSEHSGEHTITLPHLDTNVTTEVKEMVRKRRQSNGFLFMEWVLVNDNTQYQELNGNLEMVVSRSIELANYVDSLYRPLNIRVALVDVITWSNGDQIPVVRDAETLLENFESYVPSIQSAYDSAMLITGQDILGSTVGLAYLGTMCNRDVAIGFTQDGGEGSIESVGAIAAHELGHIFNMRHDSSSCTCTDPSGSCIMAAVSNSLNPQTVWSSCSISDLESGFSSRNLGRCLINEPSVTVGDPVCGNGIREADEICDCGSPDECTDSCCNPATCQLKDGAQCSAGPCCTATCQYVAYGTTCRASSGECDIVEYCPGDSSECPEDNFKQDGISCEGNTGYCYQGSCPTHDQQCKDSFGSGSGKGVNECYTQHNGDGDQFGNCGHTQTQFIACDASDVQCGQLQCIPGSFRNTFGVSVSILTVSVFSSGRIEDCQSFTTQPGTVGSDFISPGLVHEGTRCGNNRICVDHSCVAISVDSCPVGSNGQTCSGNGVCNNDGVCSCNVGFTGNMCEISYNGPGDDNPTNECLTNNGGCDHICTDTDSGFTCSCNSGYTLNSDGRACNDVNECQSNNGGCDQLCVNQPGTFRCECNAGYVLASNGRSCSDINECNTNNGGCGHICTNTQGSFQCSCRSGYQLAADARNCVDVNECQSNNGGCDQLCVNQPGSHRCECNAGFVLASDGTSCSDTNECNTNNGGCGHICTNTQGSFVCSCRSGYELAADASNCVDVNECQSNNGGCDQLCVNQPGSHSCECNAGFVLASDGTSCSDINECNTNNGGCGHICTNTQGSFVCSCRSGYQLAADANNCVDINECNTNNGGCGHICTNTQGSFVCSCRSGHQLAADDRNCVVIEPIPINECLTNNGGCEHTCTDTDSGFTCSCNSGYTLDSDGRACNDVNECQSDNGGCDQLCVNQPGSHRCECNAGFVLASDGRSCSDINECNTNNGGCGHICTNTPGSFVCSCRSGYQLAADASNCVDVNECQSNNGGCDQLCVNQPGSHRCECSAGFVLDSDGRSCSDINECITNNGGCGHICTNTQGSFVCSCRSGYELAADARNCVVIEPIPINECLTNNGGCEHTCTDTGSGFTCSCNSGYTLDSDGKACNDVNECQSSNGGCDQLCVNQPGSHRCECSTGFVLASDGSGCSDINECDTNNGGCGHICTNTQGSFECSCRSGYGLAADASNCVDVNECITNNGGCGHICTNTQGSFVCSCRSGYELAADARNCVEQTPINECLANNGGCEHTCTFTASGSVCSCDSGYSLNSDGRTCSDVNECNTNNGGCSQICTNSPPGSFQCSCTAGYVLGSDLRSCIDVNECSTGNGGCEHVCTNTIGSFSCSCDNGFTLAGDGKSCEQDIIQCGGKLTADSGSFQTPNWPQTYPVDTQCEWIIQLSESSKKIQFTFEPSVYGLTDNPPTPCQRDWVEFYDGAEDSAPSLGRFCYMILPPPVTTTSNVARVKFNAGPSHGPNRLGFRVTYTALEIPTDCDSAGCEQECTSLGGVAVCSCGPGFDLGADGKSCKAAIICGGTLTADSGSFQTPNWPETYPVDTQCEWVIQMSESSKKIQFTFEPTVYGLTDNPPTPCERDWVEFYDGMEDSAPSLGRFCYMILPPSVTTTSNVARVKFIAGPFHGPNRRGFRVTYTALEIPTDCDSAGCEQECTSLGGVAVCSCRPGFDLGADGKSCKAAIICGGTLTANSGSFQTPNWPETYPVDTQCEWVIQMSESSKTIQFTFDPTEYGLTDNPPTPCERDWVEFFDGAEDSAPSLGRFCHKILPSAVITTTNVARVKFNAGPFHGPKRRGFRVAYLSMN